MISVMGHLISISEESTIEFRIYKATPCGGHFYLSNEPVHEISNNVVCETSKASDQPAHTCSLTRAFASRLSITD